MGSTKRQLTGVDKFLDWRPLEFVDEIPEALVCTMCGVIPAFPKRILTCCHVFCPACFENIAERERVCPLDRGSFLSETVETLNSIQAGLKKLRVLCPNSPRGCTFIGKVSKLKQHFLKECRLGEVQCPRCGTAMPQREAVDHYLGHCSERPTAKSGVIRQSSSFNLAAVEAKSSGGSSRENSSGSFSSSSASRRRKTRSGAKSSIVRRVASTETTSTAAAGKEPLTSLIKYHLDAGSSSRSISGGSSKDPSRKSSLMKSSSEAKSSRNKSSKALKGSESVPEVSSQKDEFAQKEDLGVNSAQKKTVPCEATSKQHPPSTSGACIPTPSAATPTMGSPRIKSPGLPRSKTAATAVPVSFAFSYLTSIEDAVSRLTCGEEVVLRSDSFHMADFSFRVHARLRRDKDGVVLASFALCACGGTWQRIAEWSLATAMNLVLVHPWDQSRNMRLPLVPNPDSVPVPPSAHLGRWDFWSPTTEFKLAEVKARGFLSSDSLCVAVEVE